MRILAGIPTRLRKTAGQIADQIAPYVDDVIIVSQGAETTFSASNITVIEKPVDYGLMNAANFIYEAAIDGNYDLVLRCDDDLKIVPTVIPILIDIIKEEPWIGIIGSTPRQFQKWNEKITSSKKYLIVPSGAQFWLTRVKSIREVGLVGTEMFEDMELGLKLWRNGWISGRLHIGYDYCHNPKIARMGKDEDEGGISFIKGYENQKKAIVYMKENYGDLLSTMKAASMFSNRMFTARYNWETMCQYARQRWGTVGYEDSRGNVI